MMLAVALIFSSVSFASADVDPATYTELEGTDFEDGDVWGFDAGGGTTATVQEDVYGNHYLLTTGAGNGGRSITKSLTPTTDAKVLFTFDWAPGEVSTAANSSELLFRDTSGNPLLRIAKAGGPDGALKVGIGTTGANLAADQTITGVTTDGSWLSVEVEFDFEAEAASLSIHDLGNPANSYAAANLDFSGINYVNSIGSLAINGNRASGNTLAFETSLDDVRVYGNGEPAPVQGAQNVTAIVTDYEEELSLPPGLSEEEVIAYFPRSVEVQLDSGVVIQGISVSWDSPDYDPNLQATYTFIGALNVEGIPNVENGLDVQAEVAVTLTEVGGIPPIEGYEAAYYSDFGDSVAVVPPNWGFTTAAATVSIHSEDLAGNATPKLEYSIVNQSGGRVATKDFEAAVKGNEILVKFDWYPGKNNDKGDRASENGGEFRIIDGSNNIVFTLNNTNQAPLTYFVGGRAENAVSTGITNPEAWYQFEVNFDLIAQVAELTITDSATGNVESYTISLDGVAFDGSIQSIKLVGIRTSGNNHTWSTYLDNFGVYHVPIPDHTIVSIDQLPYHHIYVGEATSEVQSIGLPSEVKVTLADNRKVLVPISEWTAVAGWDAEETGVYEFTGTLAQTDTVLNTFDRSATIYVYNRLTPPDTARQTEWLDRGLMALKAEEGIFVSWRLLADEYEKDMKYFLFRNGRLLHIRPLTNTNFLDLGGEPGDTYRLLSIVPRKGMEVDKVVAEGNDYLAIPMQKPEGGETATGPYTYSVNDASVGDLDGDGTYEVIVKWYPSNAIDSSQQGMTGPTIFDAYKLDGTLLWRMNMGHNLTSGAHYNQFIVADLDGNGKSEFLIKTADATTVYGTTDGMYDSNKVISVIGNAEDDGLWVNDSGHVFGGPEYMSVFDGETGEVIDTIDYVFALGDVASWGDTWHNRSDRFLSGLAYLDGMKPSAIYGRGYYERTTFVAYSLVEGELVEEWTFDSAEEGRGGGLGYHSLATGDVDNDGYDEIIAGSLTLDQDGTILYAMDGEMGRELGSHGDALHVGAFDPDREGLHVIGVHEVPAVASVEYHDGATGETLMSYYGYVDAGRGLAANISSHPGFEFWGTGGPDAASGGGIYNVQGEVVADSFRHAGLSVNFALHWDGDLFNELLDKTTISEYNEVTGSAEVVQSFEGVTSNNGTKATPSLQADILGDWREEVLLPTTDSSELRIHSTTIPTEYRIYTLMHDPVYRMGVAWQNSAYNQPPHLGFYLGEDTREQVLDGELSAPEVQYTNEPGRPGKGRGNDKDKGKDNDRDRDE